MKKLLLAIAVIIVAGCKSNDAEIRVVSERYANDKIAPTLGDGWHIVPQKQEGINIIKRSHADQMGLYLKLEKIWLDYKTSIEVPTGEDLRDFLIREAHERSMRQALLDVNLENGYYSIPFTVENKVKNKTYSLDVVLSKDFVVQNQPIDNARIDSMMIDIEQWQ